MITHFRCHICGESRPDAMISVHVTDLSPEFNMTKGTFKQNVRYCNDRPSCVTEAKTFRLVPTLKS